jgi:hypothetical protein
MVPPEQLSAALKDGGKVATAMKFDDGSQAYVPLDRVHDAIHDGGMLMGAPPSKPAVNVQPVPESGAAQVAAERIGNLVNTPSQIAAGLKEAVPKLANDVYDVSTPGIAAEVYKSLKGQPNNLKQLPPKLVIAWLAAGGAPEGEAVEAGAQKAATEASPVADAAAIPKRYAPPAEIAPQAPPQPTSPSTPAAPSATRPRWVNGSLTDPLLDRLRDIAAKIQKQEAAGGEADSDLTQELKDDLKSVRARKPSTAQKGVRVPEPGEDLVGLLEESLKQLPPKQRAAAQ